MTSARSPHIRQIAAVAGAVLLGPALAWAGTTETLSVTVASGDFSSWSIDGTPDPPLTLVRGRTYVLDLTGVPAFHPFNINTINTTGNGNRYNSGVTNNGATGETDITFIVPNDAPDTLHYNCGNHGAMNGPITIISEEVPIFKDGFEP
ncbi:hypothetical protein [Tahibacter amnicola]|uniref:Blue (type 1) copper domain-containing protein n=1 Tax=Tahibacter amnicola TaxID=2976241 RepID=A0ABY6BKT1_9GAMM|nr:hypothetical protein [Tahibacter amnicola]UXI70374.1 hypothetical protein N4264_12290 [Tahibacter amnicola]